MNGFDGDGNKNRYVVGIFPQRCFSAGRFWKHVGSLYQVIRSEGRPMAHIPGDS